MRTPSDNLVDLLTDLQLCSRADVAACESHVNRLCRDLPDFDSVWIDALVQRRVLSPWQASVLQSSDSSSLRIGNWVCLDALGSHTFLVRPVDADQLSVLHHLNSLRNDPLVLELAPDTVPPRSLAFPYRDQATEGSDTDTSQHDIISDYVPGWTAEELLIRGGRLPWLSVAEIGRSLLTAVQWLEAQQFIHGEITLRNVRITPAGRAILVAPFVHQATHPAVSFRDDLQLKDVAFVAPELVGSGSAADSRSELYAVGLVLWQLLTARPPFLSADPVQRVLQAQQRDVADVRTIVPDCPADLARQIHGLTRRTPELRPVSADDALKQWMTLSSAGCSQTRRLVRQLPDRHHIRPVFRRRNRGVQTLLPVAVIVMMAGAFLMYGLHRGLLPQSLSLSGNRPPADTAVSADDIATESSNDSEAARTAAVAEERPHDENNQQPQLVPRPDEAGVIVLESGRHYVARPIQFLGVLHIETTDRTPASVDCSGPQAWNIDATQIVASQVIIHGRVRANCDRLTINRCIFAGGNLNAADGMLEWSPRASRETAVSISNSVFEGSGNGLRVRRIPAAWQLRNLLFDVQGTAVRCDISSDTNVAELMMDHVTSVSGASFLDVVKAEGTADFALRLTCGESVLAPGGSIVRIAGPAAWQRSQATVAFLLLDRGNPTVIPPDVTPVAFLDPKLRSLVELSPDQVSSESLLIARPVFPDASSDGGRFHRYKLVDYEGPKLSPRMPGVDITGLVDPASR